MPSALELALLSCALLGFRHGFDYDHLAAITDITSVQRSWREGMKLALLYALGHAFTVAVLGVGVLFLHLRLPQGMDAVSERVVGATLVALGIYVLAAFFRRGSGHRHAIPVSRIALMVTASRRATWRLRRLFGASEERPDDFSFRYDRSSVFAVGVVHGLGAETPSQLMLFLLASNLGGTHLGLMGLLCFIAGLLAMNTLMTASASGLFASSKSKPRLQAVVTSLTAVYSLVIGGIFLFGVSDRLPPLLQ